MLPVPASQPPLSQSQKPHPQPQSAPASLSAPASSVPTIQKQKLNVKRKRASNNVDVNIGGKTNRISTVHINQASQVTTLVIVKGGVTYITVPNLRKAFGGPNKTCGSKSGGSVTGGAKKDQSSKGKASGSGTGGAKKYQSSKRKWFWKKETYSLMHCCDLSCTEEIFSLLL